METNTYTSLLYLCVPLISVIIDYWLSMFIVYVDICLAVM